MGLGSTDTGLGGKNRDGDGDDEVRHCDSDGGDDNDNYSSDNNDDNDVNNDDNSINNDNNNNDNNNNSNNNNHNDNNLSSLVKLSIGAEKYKELIKSLKNKLKINENENKISKNSEHKSNITITWGEFLLLFIPTIKEGHNQSGVALSTDEMAILRNLNLLGSYLMSLRVTSLYECIFLIICVGLCTYICICICMFLYIYIM
jgi:hypothetical protein